MSTHNSQIQELNKRANAIAPKSVEKLRRIQNRNEVLYGCMDVLWVWLSYEKDKTTNVAAALRDAYIECSKLIER